MEPRLERQKVILDCDTGADDALAILMAVGLAQRKQLLGVTTVHGNADPSTAYDNTRRVLAAAGAPDVPVIAGATCELRTLDRGKRVRSQGCGSQAIAFHFLPEAPPPQGSTEISGDGVLNGQSDHAAANFLISTVREHQDVDLVFTGPLTNLALALRQDPSLAGRVRTLTIMGGCFWVDWAYAEFNFASDPIATAEVLSANWTVPPVIVGLNLTCQAHLPPWLVSLIGKAQEPVASTASAILRHIDPHGWNESSGDGWEMFDACALAAWADPSLVECEDIEVWISEKSGFSFWQEPASADRRGPCKHVGTLRVARSINKAAFLDFTLDSLHVSREGA
eukprot:TRINITY_DN32262_c0_g1_i1.p1 TRINITY_DN32262_c0_g1~~TRINITY_DN32262_c0_g1_i1.p1  ORF type:complete len:338 (+),score=7.21 TRINITY_DN32262_c0_g1_i1:74-1087(+)